jgi:hypothetical protein
VEGVEPVNKLRLSFRLKENRVPVRLELEAEATLF